MNFRVTRLFPQTPIILQVKPAPLLSIEQGKNGILGRREMNFFDYHRILCAMQCALLCRPSSRWRHQSPVGHRPG